MYCMHNCYHHFDQRGLLGNQPSKFGVGAGTSEEPSDCDIFCGRYCCVTYSTVVFHFLTRAPGTELPHYKHIAGARWSILVTSIFLY